MRAVVTLVSVCFLIATLSGQMKVNLESPQLDDLIVNKSSIPVVKGQLLNYFPYADAEIFIEYTFQSFTSKGIKTKHTTVDSSGKFSIELEYGIPYQQIWLKIDDYYFGEIIAHKDVEILCDLNAVKSKKVLYYGKGIDFSGDDAAVNIYVNQWQLYKQKEKTKIKREIRSVNSNILSQNAYKVRQLDALFGDLVKLEKSFVKKYGSKYQWLLENERINDYCSELITMHYGKTVESDIWELILDHKPIMFSNSSSKFYFLLGNYLQSRNAREEAMIAKKMMKKEAKDEDEKTRIDEFLHENEKKSAGVPYNESLYKDYQDSFLLAYNENLKSAKFELLQDKLVLLPERKAAMTILLSQAAGPEENKIFQEKLIPLIKIKWCIDILQSSLSSDFDRINQISAIFKEGIKIKRTVNLGDPLKTLKTGASLYIANAKTAEDLVNNIRINYKDQAVIISFWTTWSTPAFNDMRKSSHISYQIKDLPVKLIYLCLDGASTLDRWEELITEANSEGDHIYLNKGLSVDSKDFFDFSQFPHHIFIDAKGNYDPNLIKSISTIKVSDLSKKF